MNSKRTASPFLLYAMLGAVLLTGAGLVPWSAADGHAQVAVEYAGQAATKGGGPVPGRDSRAGGQAKAPAVAARKAQAVELPPQPANTPTCVGDMAAPVAINVVSGKSTLFKLPTPITLRTLGDEDVVQARLMTPQLLYVLGVGVGSTNMILQDAAGVCTVVDVTVGMDTGALQAKLAQLLPEEKGIRVSSAADSIVLSGMASDAVKVDHAVTLANAYVRAALDGGRLGSSRGASAAATGTGGQGAQVAAGRQNARVVNLLSVAAPQQVLLEVKVAEVSKSLIDKLGVSLNLNRVNGDWTFSILADLLSGGAGLIDVFNRVTGEFVTIDGEKKDGLIKILAEPNLMAISGQEGSFLAGGTVYFPIAETANNNGMPTITLQPEDFGVSLKFTPTVLDGGRINLKVTPEVSELSPEGVAIQAVSAVGRSIAPLITKRRASTTVQLFDGQSFVIGGLIKNNVGTDIKAFPVLGEIPMIGALFRSTAFQTNKSELLFVVTPRLVKPIAGSVRLPTDSYVEPSRVDLFIGGRMEGEPSVAAPSTAPTQPGTPARGPSGFEMK